jgi:hypothetical protein
MDAEQLTAKLTDLCVDGPFPVEDLEEVAAMYAEALRTGKMDDVTIFVASDRGVSEVGHRAAMLAAGFSERDIGITFAFAAIEVRRRAEALRDYADRLERSGADRR